MTSLVLYCPVHSGRSAEHQLCPQVIKLISQVIADFASGEISQQEYQFDTDITLQQYLDKSFYKTATLIAASCKSAAAFSDVPVEVCPFEQQPFGPIRTLSQSYY